MAAKEATSLGSALRAVLRELSESAWSVAVPTFGRQSRVTSVSLIVIQCGRPELMVWTGPTGWHVDARVGVADGGDPI
jgi:hypothetical protein